MFSEFIYWDHSYNLVLLINLAIAIAIFTSIRIFSGVISNISASAELFKKDNIAFGISMAGVAFAVTIILTGTIYGDPINNLMDSVVGVGVYGVLGIVLMAIARIILDKVCLPDISIRDQIVKGNIAAAIVDAGNVIATALVIRAVMVWVETNTLEGIQAVIGAFVISQIVLTSITYLRIKMFDAKNGGSSLQKLLESGNTAISLRFAGRRIEAAFAITAASNIMVYEILNISQMLLVWALISLLMILIINVLSMIADKIILHNIDVENELIKQKNAALGAVQATIYISIGILFAELMA